MENKYKYWIIQDGLRKGPFTFEEMKGLSLAPDTPVWRDGMDNWQALRDVYEFRMADSAGIPPIPPVPPTEAATGTSPNSYRRRPNFGNMRPMPRTYMVWSIITMLLCCLVPGIVALVYSFKVSSRYSAGDYYGSLKASDRAATWIIITVICGLIILPFQTLLMLI